MIISEWPEIREIGIDIRCGPNVLKSVSFSDGTTFPFVFGEDDHIRILIGKVLIRSMALNELVYRNLYLVNNSIRRGGYIDSEVMTQFSDPISLKFPTAIGKKDIRNLPIMQRFKSSCAGRDGIRPKHQDTIDIKCESIIEFRIDDMEVPFSKMHRMECIATINTER